MYMDKKIKIFTFEFLYGICLPFCFEPRAAMTSPKALKLPLIFFASSKRWPVAPESLTLSDPAKSTKFKQLVILLSVRSLYPTILRINTKVYYQFSLLSSI